MSKQAKQGDTADQAKKTVYRLLTIRLRSEQELREKLISRKFPAAIIKQTIDYFKWLSLIDDGVFARQWTVSRLKKPFGLNRIRLELKKKGIKKTVVERAINEVARSYDEFQVVEQLVRHRLEKYGNLEPQKAKQRIYGLLIRKGFSSGNIMKAIRAI